MATVTCTGAFTVDIYMETLVGFSSQKKGYIELSDGYVKPYTEGRWGLQTTWGETRYWGQNPTLPIRWTSELLDLGSVKDFTLNITSEFDGSISYIVHTSDLGLFAGEENEYLIEEGNTNIPAFSGQFVYVTARLNGRQLRRMTIEANSSTVNIQLTNVDTSTLPGTVGNRQLTVGRNISGILDVKVAVRAATAYPVNLYVSDTPTSEVLIPVVRSKGATPTIGLFGIDNDPRDGIVDIEFKALASQVMLGGNVYVL